MEMPTKPPGRPLFLGAELDAKVLTYLSAIRDIGGVVNRKVAMACALGIIREPSLLKEHGGSLKLVHERAMACHGAIPCWKWQGW